MIDAELIKESYSRMTNGELIHLAETEGQELTGEALGILHDEFSRRRMDMAVFGTIEEDKADQYKLNIQAAQNSASSEFANSIWEYALNQKEAGATDGEIQKGLMERGMDEEHSKMISQALITRAKEVLHTHDSDMLKGGVIFGIGLFITVATSSSIHSGGPFIMAWGAIAFGAIRFFRGLTNRGKYQTILDNIEAEHAAEIISEDDAEGPVVINEQ